jgi:hypothetical protein
MGVSTVPEVPSNISPKEFFEAFLVENFAAVSGGKVQNVPAVLEVRVRGDGGGTWSLTVKDGKLVVRPEGDPAALATMQMDTAVWRELMAKSAEFSARTQGNIAGAFKFLFPDAQMIQLIKNTLQGTAEIRLKRDGAEPLSLFFGFKECRAEAPKTKVTMALGDWMDIAARKAVPAQIYMSGKATVEGDLALAMNMSMLLA